MFAVETEAGDKTEYLQFPAKGRLINAEGERLLRKACKDRPQVQIVISDGLSAKAVDRQLPDILPALRDSLAANSLAEGTAFFVKRGRVGVMDDIGRILRPEVLVLLIGERPGLAASASLSAYMCYRPQPGRRDSERNVISNIHQKGTPPVEAGAHIGSILRKMVDQRRSGVQLEL
ncbi:Ethanolamine ammonia-lyase light chain [compost metagenome]